MPAERSVAHPTPPPLLLALDGSSSNAFAASAKVRDDEGTGGQITATDSSPFLPSISKKGSLPPASSAPRSRSNSGSPLLAAASVSHGTASKKRSAPPTTKAAPPSATASLPKDWCLRGGPANGSSKATTEPTTTTTTATTTASAAANDGRTGASRNAYRQDKLAVHSHALGNSGRASRMLPLEGLPSNGLMPTGGNGAPALSAAPTLMVVGGRGSGGGARSRKREGDGEAGTESASPNTSAVVLSSSPSSSPKGPVLRTVEDAARAARAEELKRQLHVKEVTDFAYENDRRDYLKLLEEAQQEIEAREAREAREDEGAEEVEEAEEEEPVEYEDDSDP